MGKFGITSIGTLAAALCWGGTPASAQDAAPPKDQGLAEIVVTARRVTENLQNVPVSVTVLSGADIRAQNMRTALDFVTSTPNLQVREAGGNPSALVLTIRGQVQNDILGTLDSSIGVYVDGVNYSRAIGLNGGLLDVNRVEILKGPQGTLFGRNTTGGAFNITTGTVDLTKIEGSARISVGNFGRFDKEAMINLPLVADKLAIRLAGEQLKSAGFGHDLTSGRHLAADNNYTVRAKLRWKPIDSLDFVASYEHFNMSQAGPVQRPVYVSPNNVIPVAPGVNIVVPSTPELLAALSTGGCFDANFLRGLATPAFNCPGGTTFTPGARTFASYIGGNPYSSYNNVFPLVTAKTDTASLTGSWDSPIGTLKYIGAYRKVSNSTPIDLDGTPFPILQTTTIQASHSWSHELQLSGNTLNHALDYTFGLFAFNEHGTDGSTTFALSFLNPANPSSTFGIINNQSRAAYGQGTYHLTDALSVTGGLRYSKDIKKLDSRNSAAGGTICDVPVSLRNNPAVACSALLQRDDSAVSYTASVNYQLDRNVLIYAKTSRGYRAGGENLRGTDLLSYQAFLPETVTDYELGAKSEFLDRHVRLNLAGYYSNYNNIQKSTIVPNGNGGTSTIVSNAAKAHIKGAEAELTVLPLHGLQLTGSLGLTDPKFTSFAATCIYPGGPASGTPCDRSGEKFEQVPDVTWSVGAQYSLPTSFGSLNARADYRYVSSITFQSITATQTPALVPYVTQAGYGLLGARVSADVTALHGTIAVFGTNLTNKRYDIGALDFVNSGLGYIERQIGAPRQYGVELAVRF